MAKRWREAREPYLSFGRDNSIESSDFEEELEDFEKFLLGLKHGGQITAEEYCQLWSEVREEWEKFALKAIDYSQREPVAEIEHEDIESLLKQLIKQQQEIIGLLRLSIKGDS